MSEGLEKRFPDLPVRYFWIALGVLLAAVFFYVEWVSWTRFASHHVYVVDAGNFDAILSGPRHGRFLRSPYDWTVDANYFGGHFRPVLIYLMPLYFLFDHPMTLLTVQNLSYVLAAIPLALFTFSLLRNRMLSLFFAFLYLTNHFVASVQFAIHPEIMSFVSFFAIFLAVEKKKPVLLAVAVIWTLSIKEDFGIYMSAYGASLFLEKDRTKWKWGGWLIGSGIAGLIIANFVMDWSGREAFVTGGNNPLSRFGDFGDSKSEVLIYLLAHPFEIAGRVFRPLLLLVFASAGFLSLLDWRAFWLTIMGAAVFMITGDHLVGELAYYYSYPAIPFLFYSAVRGSRVLLQKTNGSRPFYMLAGLIVLLAVVQAPMRTRTDGLRRVPFAILDHHRFFEDALEQIPQDATVAVQFDLFARVPNREVKLPLRSEYLTLVEYAVVDIRGKFGDIGGVENETEAKLIGDILQSDFEVVYSDAGYYVFKRIEPGRGQK